MTDTVENLIPKPVRITPSKRNELERKCQNRLNWSDGGNWIGTGDKPNCFIKDNLRSSISHTYNFPTDAAATKWNMEWEKEIRYAGHVGTAGLTVALTYFTGGVAAIVVGTLAAITKDELQASIPYPRMARGWSYEVIFEHQFKWSPHPWGQREFIQTTTTISRNFDGKIISRASNVKKYKLAELPDGFGRLLASTPSKKSQSDYQ